MIGELLGNYRLVAQIGSGSMGVVFLAQHRRIVRQVAIKLLAPELVRDQRALELFFNEARATSLIRHPGIVDIFDCDVDATGRAYIVLEHLDGETLADRLQRAGRLHWSAACLIARRVADALGAAHDKGIVHRDLKPENMFLVGNGRDPAAGVKVLDFGVAKLLASEAVTRSPIRGTLIGTPEYMSPEQCAGTDVDHRADIYALGCILFEMLTGQPPFVTSTVRELVLAHRFKAAPSAAVSCPDLPDWLDHLLQRMMAKEPERRPQSMREVSEALSRYKAQRWTHIAAGGRQSEQRERRGTPRARDGADPAITRWLRRRRTEATVVLVALVVLAGAAWAIRRNAVVRSSSEVMMIKSPPRVPTEVVGL
jgi:serine/threonine protein kinase